MKIAIDARAALAAALLAFAGAVHAAAFDLTDVQGKHHRLADLRGHWVVVNFWATWCVPCIQEIPEIAAFAREHPQVAVIGVATDSEDPAKVKRFAAKLGHGYPLVLSNDAVERQLGRPAALPTTQVYDPTGRLVYDRAGRVDRKALETITRSGAAKPMQSADRRSASKARVGVREAPRRPESAKQPAGKFARNFPPAFSS
jgi:thiol-disulfide isomerase/thioredoxin